jgi:NADP-dependent 3-hydroxy acid dehydrogenase YdfG
LKDAKYGTSLVAVFVGATSGIGMGTLKQFAKLTKSPKAYIAVRSIQAATPLLNELKASNPQGTFILHETEISLMKNVDNMCDEIKKSEKKVDFVFATPGYLSFDARNGKLSWRKRSGFSLTNR